MSDFLEADISDLLHDIPEPIDDTEAAYIELMQRDNEMISGFTETDRSRLHWPDPVRKKHIR